MLLVQDAQEQWTYTEVLILWVQDALEQWTYMDTLMPWVLEYNIHDCSSD